MIIVTLEGKNWKLFSRKSVERLQRILMFKYLDFTLEEIRQMLEEENIQESFGKQLELIELKITHLNQIKKQSKICNHYQMRKIGIRCLI